MNNSLFFSMVLILIFAVNPFGAVVNYMRHVGEHLTRKEHVKLISRELFFALIIMILFHFLGEALFALLNLSYTTVQLAGGIVLFLISIRLIFPSEDDVKRPWHRGKPFIVPIATPLIAGPSVLAIIMIYSREEPRDWVMILAIFIAWLISGAIILLGPTLTRLLTEKGMDAIERLTGLIVALIAIQKFLEGIRSFTTAWI